MKVNILLSMLFFPLILLGEEDISEEIYKYRRDEREFLKNGSWFGKDKIRHFLGSCLLTGASSWWYSHRCSKSRSEGIRFGIGFTFSLGVIKEFQDRQKTLGFFSLKDIMADIFGIGVGALLLGGW